MKEQNLSYKFYRPETEAEAVVFCVHGMQEHKMRYDAFAKYLNENGIACITYDLPGHGKVQKMENQDISLIRMDGKHW